MSDAKLILIGGAVGLVAFAVWKYFFANPGIDPTTGGVALPPGVTYGPPVPGTTAVDPGYIAEGLQ